jgi:hypothetical protein
MPELLFAADTPRHFAAPAFKARRRFASDIERFAWLAAQYRHSLKPGLKKAAIAFDIALEAFGVTIDDLSQPGTQPRARAKIICAVRILTGASYAHIASKLGVSRQAAQRAHLRLRHEVSIQLGVEEHN